MEAEGCKDLDEHGSIGDVDFDFLAGFVGSALGRSFISEDEVAAGGAQAEELVGGAKLAIAVEDLVDFELAVSGRMVPVAGEYRADIVRFAAQGEFDFGFDGHAS